jgi:hypothetical protein
MAERHSDLRRRMRATVFWTVGVFLAMQLLTSLMLDCAWPLLRFPSAATLVSELRRSSAHPEIICLGSSRFGAGINSPVVESAIALQTGMASPPVVFNAAMPWGDLITDEFMLEALLNSGEHPRLLVVEVSCESLQRRNRWMPAHVLRELRWQDLPRFVKDVTASRQLGRLLGSKLLPLYIHRSDIWREAKSLLPVDDQATDSSAEECVPPPTPADWHKIIIHQPAENVRSWLRSYAPGGYSVWCLERLLQRCREDDIAVILIGVPVSKAYRNMVSPETDSAYRASIDELCNEYGCRFVDCRDRLPDEMFEDIHHLSPAGAEEFSRLLGREVLGPAWGELNR